MQTRYGADHDSGEAGDMGTCDSDGHQKCVGRLFDRACTTPLHSHIRKSSVSSVCPGHLARDFIEHFRYSISLIILRILGNTE